MRKIKNYIKKLFVPVAYFFENLTTGRNHFHLSEAASISKNAHIEGSTLSGSVKIGGNTKIHLAEIGGKVTIGDHTTLWGPHLVVSSEIHPITIGKFCSIARNVTIQEFNHNYKRPSSHFMNQNLFGGTYKKDISSVGEIYIGNDVWIGTLTVILSGARIGDGAVIAANSAVTGEIPPYAIAGGTPARVIKYRFSEEIIHKLMELKWWDWPEEKLKNNKTFFTEELTIDGFEKIVE